MNTKLGDAGRARELAELFEAWRRAFDAQDHASMQRTKRAIDAQARKALRIGEKVFAKK
jgi:hypothetical protein